MPRFDAEQFIRGGAQCELASNLYALPPQQLPQSAFLYKASMPEHQQDFALLQELLEDFMGQYVPAQSVVMLGDAKIVLDQPIGALMTKFLQEGAEGLSWTGVDGGVETGTVGIAASDEEGNDQTILLHFEPLSVGLQHQVHGFYNGQQPDRTHVAPYCDIVCQLYSHLLKSSNRFQPFHHMLVDKTSRAHIPFMAAHAGFSLEIRPMQAGLGLTIANTPLSTSSSPTLVDFAFHHLSRVFGSKEAMMNLCHRNCRDAGFEQFQALRRTVRGNFVRFTDAILSSQPAAAAPMVFEISDLMCVSASLACLSPDMFVRFQRFNLNIPEATQVAHLPVACLMLTTRPLETIAEQDGQSVIGPGNFDASDSSEDEQPKSKRRKGKKQGAGDQQKPAQPSTDGATHDVLEMKTDEAAQEAIAKSLDQCACIFRTSRCRKRKLVVPGYLLAEHFQIYAKERFIDSKFRQIQVLAEAIGQACATKPALGVQTNQLSSWVLTGCQLPALAVRYRSPVASDCPQYIDQPVVNGIWDLIHPTKHFAYRPHINAWVVLSLCKLGTGKSSYGVSAAQIEYFQDALCETMARFGMDVADLQGTKPIFFPNPNQSQFSALETIVQRFKLQRMDSCVVMVVCPPAMDDYERAELQWLSLCHFGVPMVMVDINTVYDNQPKKNKTERQLGALAAEINLKCKGQNFKLGYPAHGLPGILRDESDDIIISEPPEMLSMLFRDVQPYMCIGLSITPIAGRTDRWLYTACSSLDRSFARCVYEACVSSHRPPSVSEDTDSESAHCRVMAEIVGRLLTQCKNLTQRLPRMVLMYRQVDAETEWRCQRQLTNEREAIQATLHDFLGPELELHYITVSVDHGVELSVAGSWGNMSTRTLASGTLLSQGAIDVRAQQFYLSSHKPESVDDAIVPRYAVLPSASGVQTAPTLEALQAATYLACHMHQASGKVGMLPAPLTYARQLRWILNAYLSERHKDHKGARSARGELDQDGYALELLAAEGCKFVEFHPQARSGKMFLA